MREGIYQNDPTPRSLHEPSKEAAVVRVWLYRHKPQVLRGNSSHATHYRGQSKRSSKPMAKATNQRVGCRQESPAKICNLPHDMRSGFITCGIAALDGGKLGRNLEKAVYSAGVILVIAITLGGWMFATTKDFAASSRNAYKGGCAPCYANYPRCCESSGMDSKRLPG